MRRFIYRALRAFSAFDHWLRERLTPAGWVVLGTAGAAAAAGLDTNQTVTYRAFTFLAALLAIAWAASLALRARLARAATCRACHPRASAASIGGHRQPRRARAGRRERAGALSRSAAQL